LAGLAAASVVLAEWAVLEALGVLAEWVGLVEWAALEELVAPEARVVLGSRVVRAASAGPTGQHSGSTTRSTAAQRLMEIDPRPTSSEV
jgi:hypothetical protein